MTTPEFIEHHNQRGGLDIKGYYSVWKYDTDCRMSFKNWLQKCFRIQGLEKEVAIEAADYYLKKLEL